MVRSNAANLSLGNADELNVLFSAPTTPVIEQQSYLRFNLDNLPANAVIDSAFLSLYFNPNDDYSFGNEHSSNTTPSLLHIERVTQNWLQSTLNWSNKPPTSTVNRVAVSQAQYPGGTCNFTHMDVTNLVRDMLDTSLTGNHGLQLSIFPQSSVRYLMFASSNHPNANLRPKLELCWHADSTINNNEIYTSAHIALYPNPVVQTLIISTDAIDVESYQLYNAAGQMCKTGSVSAPLTRLDIRNLAAGQYFIRFNDGSVRSVFISE